MKEISLFDVPDADERGVSPVIGVILMVAITVILAAVIATFVLGFPDQVSESVNAGADISKSSDGNATVTWISQGNAEYLNVTAKNTDASNPVQLKQVGESVKVTGNTAGVSTNIVVTAYGESGTGTVVAQKELVLNESS
ncbi:type IV pilin [Halobacterium wangiae]|uniref:type IV pilin n=1 Tax=Halobacterium wangiae TaxID=2902623 RepID=UPI001E31C4F2|nr:type IV pilin [Halobacterium wangiae]